jgi:hypothetical protein
MNWDLFTAVLALGLAAALLNLRRELTPLEAWSLVLSRAAAAALLAYFLPEQVNGLTMLTLAVWETASAIAGASVYVTGRLVSRREGDRWLRAWRQAETRRWKSPRRQGDTSAP